jgi:peptide/nickel transport system permease protein
MASIGLSQRWFGKWAGLEVEPGSTVWYFRRDRLAMISLAMIVLMVLLAIFAPLLTPYPNQGAGEPDIANKLMAPSSAHIFGTDPLGRDVVARVLFGARTALIAAFLINLSALVVGTLLGALAGYFGGWLDEVIMRLTDVFLAFPPLLLAMTIAAVLGPSLENTIVAISLTWWTWHARLARAQTVTIREQNYVKAARGIGVNDYSIILRHILPNIMTPVLVQTTIDMGSAILTVGALSFVGLGVPAPMADWGQMISEGRIYVQNGRWWIGTFPGLALFITAMSFNLLGDGVQLVTNPKARGEIQT